MTGRNFRNDPNYPKKRVMLKRMEDPYTTLVDGMMGTIVGEDDAGHLLVNWDNGSRLSLLPGIDEYEIIEERRYIKMFENFDKEYNYDNDDEDFDDDKNLDWCPICLESPENCVCDYNTDDDYDDDDSNIDLSIELENKLRTLSDDSKLTIDDFLEEFGVNPEDMTGFGWASILKNAQQYKKMSDEEFNKLYDEYKNSVNESLITEKKNIPTNSKLWSACKAWAKSRYDVWPSAYAVGAAAKRYKKKGGKWKKKKSKKK
jgi:hypothetical protein